jgi:hypothetical protein
MPSLQAGRDLARVEAVLHQARPIQKQQLHGEDRDQDQELEDQEVEEDQEAEAKAEEDSESGDSGEASRLTLDCFRRALQLRRLAQGHDPTFPGAGFSVARPASAAPHLALGFLQRAVIPSVLRR